MKSFIAALLLAFPALSQQLSLSGTVVNAKTGEPIAHAMVSLSQLMTAELLDGPPEAPTPGQRPQLVRRSSLSDAGGRFQFSSLPSGEYMATASKPQFTAAPSNVAGQRETVKLTSSVDNVNISLSPLGVITGTITDQDGLPLPGVSVQILSSMVQDGLRHIKSDRTVTTDDRGIYRAWNLLPGRYYLKAASPGGSIEYVGSATPIGGDESFAPVYFGGSKTYDSATPIDLASGGEARADFTLRFEPAWRVAGTLNGFTSRSPIKFELVNPEGDASVIRASVNGDVGRFAAGPVVPGSWTLRATQGTSVAETPFLMEDRDLTTVAMALLPGAEVRVVTHFTNSPPPPPPVSEPVSGRQLPFRDQNVSCSAMLSPHSASVSVPKLFPKKLDDGSLGFAGVLPGKYSVELQCPGGDAYLRSAISGSQDLATDPVLTVVPGVTPAAIEITATWGGGSVKGIVKSAKSAAVILIPRFPNPEGAKFQQIFPDEDHPGDLDFSFGGLAPGTYSAWALEDNNPEFRNPQFLSGLTGGTTVQIDGDAEKELVIESVAHR